MTPADKKLAQAGLKTAMKNHSANVKLVHASFKEAQKALDKAKRGADSAIKALNKEQAAVAKKVAVGMKAAQKTFDGMQSKSVKAIESATKGTEKLAAKMAELDAIPTAVAAPAPKVKAVAKVKELTPA